MISFTEIINFYIIYKSIVDDIIYIMGVIKNMENEALQEKMKNILEKIKIFFSRYAIFILSILIIIVFILVIFSNNNQNETNSNLTLILKGSNNISIEKGSQYIEPGYSAYDTKEGDLTSKVKVEGNVFTSSIGRYTIYYHVTNSNGKTVTKTRIINVIDTELHVETSYSSKELTNNDVIITLIIDGDNYYFTLDPDGNIIKEKTITYRVKENGDYTFSIKKHDGTVIEKVITISNIDKIAPKGNCILTLTDDNGEIAVNASDNNGISGYQYLYGNIKTNILTNNKYQINSTDDKASVKIYDKVGNNITINCTINDKSKKQEREYTLESYNFNGTIKKYWFYKPNISLREKVPLVIYLHGTGGEASTNAVNSIAIPKNITPINT